MFTYVRIIKRRRLSLMIYVIEECLTVNSVNILYICIMYVTFILPFCLENGVECIVNVLVSITSMLTGV